MKKNIILILFLLFITQAFAQTFQIKIVPKIKKDSLYIAYVISFDKFPSTAPTIGTIKIVVQLDESMVDMGGGRVRRVSRYDRTNPLSGNHFRDNTVSYSGNSSIYTITRNTLSALSAYYLQNVNHDTLGIISYPLLSCTRNMSIRFDDRGGTQTVIKTWSLGEDLSKALDLVDFNGTVPKDKAPLTISENRICSGATLSLATSSKGRDYLLHTVRNGAVVGRSQVSQLPKFEDLVADRNFVSNDAFFMTFTNAYGCTDTTITKAAVVANCCDSSFTNIEDTYCVVGFSKKISVATPGGTLSGPGISFNSALNTWVFNPKSAGPGTHNIVYTTPNTPACNGKISKQKVVVDPIPCKSSISDALSKLTIPVPNGLFTNCDGEIFIASSVRKAIFKIDTFGVKSVYAGDTLSGIARDGNIYDPDPNNRPMFCQPIGIVGNLQGDIFVADGGTQSIIKIEKSTGNAFVIGGFLRSQGDNCGVNGSTSVYGIRGVSRFNNVYGLALNSSEDTLYVSETKSNTISGIELKSGNYQSFLVAGKETSPLPPVPVNGDALTATFNSPRHISVSGNYLYVADFGNDMIRRIDLKAKRVITLAGKVKKLSDPQSRINVDTSLALLDNPSAVTADCEGNAYVVEPSHNWVLRINQLQNTMSVTHFAGDPNGNPGSMPNTFDNPQALSIYTRGFVDVADYSNNRIVRIAIDEWSDNIFKNLDTTYCLFGPKDTLVPLQCSGSMYSSDPSVLEVLTEVGGRKRYAFNPTKAGTFVISYTYVSGKCTQTLTKVVKVIPTKKPDLGNDLSFCDQPLKINLKNAPFKTYSWKRDNAVVAVPNTQDFIPVVQLANNFTDIMVSTVDENNCASMDTLRISKASASFPKVDIVSGIGDTVLCKGSVVQLFAQFTPSADANRFYKSWNTNNPSDTTQYINATGSYKYVFTIADKNSPTCTKSFEKSLIVKDAPTGCYKLTNNITGNEINLNRYVVSTLPNTLGNLRKPLDVVYRGGYLYIADSENNMVKRYDLKTGLLENFIGDGIDGATDSLPPSQTQLNYPSSLAFDAKGNLFICNLGGNYISKYDSIKKKVYIVAGNPGKIGFNDGEGINSRFNKPTHLEVDNLGNVFVTDNLNNAIRKLSPIDNRSYYKVVTYTGFSGVQGAKDGKPKVAQFDYPWGIAMNSTGLIISEDLNHTIRKIGFDTLATLYSGQFKTADNVPVVDDAGVNSLDARYNKPWGITVDKQGQVFIADGFNNNIKKIDKNGKVTTIAGLGDAGSQDGDTYIATFNRPTAIAIGPDGKTLYVSDRDNGTIRQIKRDTVLVCESDFGDNMTYVNTCLDPKMTNKWYFTDEKVKDSLILSTTAAGGISISKPGLYINEISEKLGSGCSNTFRDSLLIHPKSTYMFQSNLGIGGGFSDIGKYCPDKPLELRISTIPAIPPSPSITYRITEKTLGATGKLFPVSISNDGVFYIKPSLSLLPPNKVAFTFTITVTDQDGCVHTPPGNATLRLFNSLKLEPIPNQTICLGDTINVTATQQNTYVFANNSTFWWEPAEAVFGSVEEMVQGQTKMKSTAKISPSVTTKITVKNTLPPGFNPEGCVDSTSFEVVVKPAPTVDVTPDTGLCGGVNTTLVLRASVRPPDDPSQYRFAWYNLSLPGDSTVAATKTVSPLVTTKYKLKINSPSGCTLLDTTTVGVGQAPIAKIDAPSDNLTVCPHTNVVLQGSATGGQPFKVAPTYRYEWKNIDENTLVATDNPHTLVAEKTMRIRLQVKDSIGCAGADSVSILVSSFRIDQGQKDTTICEGTSFEAKPVMASGSNSYTYLWNQASPLLSDQTIPNPILSPVDTLIPTSYILKVTDNFNCELSDTILVGVGTAPRIAVVQSALDYCQDQNYTLTATAVKGQSPYTFIWTEPSGQNIGFAQSSQSTINLMPNSAGSNFGISVMVVDANQCKSEGTSRTFNVHASPYVNFASDTVICNGNSVLLSAAFAQNAGLNLDYAWFKDGNLLSNNTNEHTLDAMGVYKAVLTSEMGCSKADSMIVAVKDSIESIQPLITGTCKGQSVKLLVDINKGSLGFNVKWATTNGHGSFDGTTERDINFYKDSIIYNSAATDPDQVDFTVQVSNACNVVSYASSQTLSPSPKAVISSVTPSAYINQPVEFGQNASNYDALVWNFGDKSPLLNSNDSKVSHTYVDANIFNVVLYALNNNGCKDSATVQVTIINNQNIFIPNVFNPTSSNPENSFVKVYGANITNSGFSFVIFNRWGQVVYETVDFAQANKIGWNGKLQNSGDELSLGAYTYLLKGKYGDGKEFEKVGTITLVK